MAAEGSTYALGASVTKTQYLKRVARWETGIKRVGAVGTEALPEAPKTPWLGADRAVRLGVRANRCALHCLHNAGRAELAVLLAQPHGRDALADALAAVGGLVAELFALCSGLASAQSPLRADEGLAQLDALRARWHALAAEGGTLPGGRQASEAAQRVGARPYTALPAQASVDTAQRPSTSDPAAFGAYAAPAAAACASPAGVRASSRPPACSCVLPAVSQLAREVPSHDGAFPAEADERNGSLHAEGAQAQPAASFAARHSLRADVSEESRGALGLEGDVLVRIEDGAQPTADAHTLAAVGGGFLSPLQQRVALARMASGVGEQTGGAPLTRTLSMSKRTSIARSPLAAVPAGGASPGGTYEFLGRMRLASNAPSAHDELLGTGSPQGACAPSLRRVGRASRTSSERRLGVEDAGAMGGYERLMSPGGRAAQFGWGARAGSPMCARAQQHWTSQQLVRPFDSAEQSTASLPAVEQPLAVWSSAGALTLLQQAAGAEQEGCSDEAERPAHAEAEHRAQPFHAPRQSSAHGAPLSVHSPVTSTTPVAGISRFGARAGAGARSQIGLAVLLAAAARTPSELRRAPADPPAAAAPAAAPAAAAAAPAAAAGPDGAAGGGCGAHAEPARAASPTATAFQPPTDWGKAELRTFRRLQALVWLLEPPPQPKRELSGPMRVQTVLDQAHSAFAHMQRGEDGHTETRLYRPAVQAGMLTCWLPEPGAEVRAASELGSSARRAAERELLSPLRIFVGSELAHNNGLVGHALSDSEGQPALHFRAMSNTRFKADVDGNLYPGQSLIVVPLEAGGVRYVLTVATRPNELIKDEASPALVELRAFVEAGARYVQAALARLHDAWDPAAPARTPLATTASRLALRLALRTSLERAMRKRGRMRAMWYRAAFRVSAAFLPVASEYKKLSEVQRLIFEARSVDMLAERVMGRFQALVRAERSTLYTYDWRRNTLTSCLAAGMRNFELQLTGARLGIIGLAVVNDECMLVEDCYAHPNFNPAVDLDSGFRTVSMICLPLHDGEGEVIGAVQLINKLHERTNERIKFEPDDLKLSQGIANQIGLAMMHIQDREQLELFHEQLAS
ncbi:hypothetical protein KFE25_006020 [Diacronema lutheri]|uniref:GAF domain-containing protein n=1 Tax=Diacronema lutheri TaxID=2081491 RepID=A0A8J6CGW6_DIALT|nr:hypothetical protein KFE25_006020 [Diacronema lutheri]